MTTHPQVSNLQLLSLRLSSSIATALLLGLSPAAAQALPSNAAPEQEPDNAALSIELDRSPLEIIQESNQPTTLSFSDGYATDASLLLAQNEGLNLETFDASDLSSNSEQPSPRPALDQQGRSQRWSVTAEYLPLKRSISDLNINTSVDINSGERFGTDDLDFDLESGTRLTLDYHIDPKSSLELRYFGLHGWESQNTFNSSTNADGDNENLYATFIADPFLGDDGEPEDYAQALSQDLTYKSDLDNIELNYRRKLDPPEDKDPWQGSLLAGLRFMNLNEDFDFTSFDGDSRRGGNIGQYNIDTNNRMIGAQLGAEGSYQVSPAFGFNAYAKGGLMLNFASQDSRLVNDGDSVETFKGKGDETLISPVVELGLFANWDVSRNVTLHAGVNYMYLANVALAPEQFADSSPATSSGSLGGLNTGAASYWGPSVGLTARF